MDIVINSMDAYINADFAKNLYDLILVSACDVFHTRSAEIDIMVDDKYYTRMELIRDIKSGKTYPITLSVEAKQMLLLVLAEIMSYAEESRAYTGQSRAEIHAQIIAQGRSDWWIAAEDFTPSKEHTNIKIMFRNKLEEFGVYDYIALYYSHYMSLFVEKIILAVTLFGLRERKK